VESRAPPRSMAARRVGTRPSGLGGAGGGAELSARGWGGGGVALQPPHARAGGGAARGGRHISQALRLGRRDLTAATLFLFLVGAVSPEPIVKFFSSSLTLVPDETTTGVTRAYSS
jgi:hypothetical protein